MKQIMLAVVGLLLLLGAVLFFNLNVAVTSVIEKVGTRALGTSVKVSGLNISLRDRKAQLKALSVANPKGFMSEHLLKTGGISVAVGAISDTTVTIKEIVVDGMAVTYELSPGGTNFDALKGNIAASSAAGNTVRSGTDDKGGKNLVIEKLKIIHAELVPSLGVVSQPLRLPDITLTNIGSSEHPATPGEVAKQVMNKVISVSTLTVMSSGLQNAVGSTLNKVKSGLKGLFSQKAN